MEFHEAANIYPLDEEHLDRLAEDIKRNGLIRPIETYQGKILDGRRRWLACERLGIKPRMVEVDTPDPVAYVVSTNERRDLTPSQRATCAARAEALREKLTAAAKERQAENLKKGSKRQTDAIRPVGENFPLREKSRVSDEVGEVWGISGKTVDYGRAVVEKGTPALVKAVDEGRMSVSRAAKLVDEPPEIQDGQAALTKKERKASGSLVVDKANEDSEIKGMGVICANEAINCLIRIKKNDPLRKRGFQIVKDWIRRNE